jgi:DNA polymerase III alpha subunit
MEMPENQNFILENGIIAHNCAYSELGYITMFIKHHYPLEWWTAVLNTEGNEDKRRHFMTIVSSMLMPPSINNPFAEFAIVDHKIVTPISALKGVGGAALQELSKHAPFSSLEDFTKRVSGSKVNAGHLAVLIKGRAFDCLFDGEGTYVEQRTRFIQKLIKLRKIKTASLDDMPITPIDIFLAEKNANTCFSKRLLADDAILQQVCNFWPGIRKLSHKDIPLRIGETFIISGAEIANKFLEKGSDLPIGMILLYTGATHKTGTSKKSGREWHKLDYSLSDGYMEVECTVWDKKIPPAWPKNSLVYVCGVLEKGFRNPIGIKASSIELIDDLSTHKIAQ